jgi:hypothetical protein
MNKIKLLFLVFLLAIRPSAKADEGMWLPFLIDNMLHEKMQQMGLELTKEQIFSFTQSSLKDAIVSFGGGCTAEIISDQGLLLTNHHCGYGRIQAHSTPERDYLTDGFWAMTREEELPNPGLFVSFLVRVEDVTQNIMQNINEQMSWKEREDVVREVSTQLVNDAVTGTHYTANVRSMFSGNEYYLFVYERFTDVRMVGTPPSSIGKFGGDTDNWMWPRHTGDFMLFRVYTAPDGTPADYSPDNVPLKPRHHLPVSIRGIQENDFVMILGYPGNTDRYLTSFGIDYKLKHEFPVRIDIRRKKLDIIEQAMAQSDEIRIKYASKQSGISNYWKNFIGMSKALQQHNVADTKREMELDFVQWVNQSPERMAEYGDVMELFSSAYKGYEGFQSHNFYFAEAIRTGADIINFAWSFHTLAQSIQQPGEDVFQEEIQTLTNRLTNLYRSFDSNVDRNLFAEMLRIYYNGVPAHLRPGIFDEINKKYKNNFEKFAEAVYKNSIFASREQVEKFLNNPSAKVLRNDWAYRLAIAFYDNNTRVQAMAEEFDHMLARANNKFAKGLREMNPDRSFYPDANSTMRFTYGTVAGYSPADAVYYDYYTTLKGVMEKKDPDHHEFVVPDLLVDLYEKADFNELGSNGTMVVNFLSNNDITGGNSGSPVIDAQGNLIGLAFDGNWEAMSGDILFEHQLQRCINVDSRYILFVIGQYAGAVHLIEEMTIVR